MGVGTQGATPRPTKYLFIDGGYLRKEYEDAMQDFFGDRGELDLLKIKGSEGALRAFYYDCLDDQQRSGESEALYRERLARVNERFDSIRSLPGFHFRPGSLAGKRQKEVDVLLAVDVLTHAFYGNMQRVVLIAGDRDFRPLVEALVRLGTYTIVRSVKRSGSEALKMAADEGHAISFLELYEWSSDTFKKTHPIPHGANGPVPEHLKKQSGKLGRWKDSAVRLYHADGHWTLVVDPYLNDMPLYLTHDDQVRL